MNKTTRSAIQRATQDARRLLEDEYQAQLQGTFDILLNGKISPKSGGHLNATERICREKLIADIDHREAGGQKKSDAVDSYLREAAFTTLNRFVALKMLEARGLVQECISKKEQSAGFKEFTGLAPGIVQLLDNGYRLYIESLFDEIGREVRVLFDRRDPASLLWPRRQVLNGLLDILNASDLAEVWQEDETIGWVYQYFNSDDERREMRKASQAPRNSRELAVRNQFFTPRYVVEFLTDNTIGRIWYEMRQGDTRLVDECDYLVRRPNEVFLSKGEDPPEESDTDDLTQEELLNKTVYIPHRAKKDPRDLKILDPACGSGHFLLYAFDLLLTVYGEGWQDDNSTTSEVTGCTLREDYPNIDDLMATLPSLILRHNLYGIDIDPRAAQIAAFALWMRTQRAYNETNIPHNNRPTIARTNIVVAEPMPGEKELLQEFTSTLQPKVLGQLVEVVFDKMQLTGEAGSLLKIEEEIRDAIGEAKALWQEGPKPEQLSLFQDDSKIKEEQLQLFDVSGITDEQFWREAEQRIYNSLERYTESSTSAAVFRRKLFANDAIRGFAFIDLCRKKYDAIVMNPPFGESPRATKEWLKRRYGLGRPDLYMCFFFRAAELAAKNGGLIGVISSRTFHTLEFFTSMRRSMLTEGPYLSVLLDTAGGVLDDATVETSIYIVRNILKNNFEDEILFFALDSTIDKDGTLRAILDQLNKGEQAQQLFLKKPSLMSLIPGGSFAYWLPSEFAELFQRYLPFNCNTAVKSLAEDQHREIEDSNTSVILQGLIPGDIGRFCRLEWEVDSTQVGRDGSWVRLLQGGQFRCYWSDEPWMISWKEDGKEIRAFAAQRYGGASRTIKNDGFFFRHAITFPRVSSGFNARVMPSNSAFSDTGMAFVPSNPNDVLKLCAILNSRLVEILTRALHPGRKFEVGHISALPNMVDQIDQEIEGLSSQIFKQAQYTLELSIISLEIRNSQPILPDCNSFQEIYKWFQRSFIDSWSKYSLIQNKIDDLIFNSLGISERTRDFAYRLFLHQLDSKSARPEILYALLPECAKKELIESQVPKPEIIGRRILYSKIRYYTSQINRSAILGADDPGGNEDFSSQLWNLMPWCESEEKNAPQSISSPDEMRSYIRTRFFDDHIKDFSSRPRRAPIYWQIATPSASYSTWLYYHHFTKDTFYAVLNDYVTPKVQHEERKLTNLIQEAGPNSTASQRKDINTQETFIEDLRAFREEIALIAPLWNPNLNDGVIINFAPLWRLTPQHRIWQKECQKCWDKLVVGDYDWSHLSMHLWPERIVPKCATDRSLAIAHDLEEVFWEEDEDGKWHPRDVSKGEIEKLIDERTSSAVKNALNDLLSAPAPAGSRRRSRTRRT
ncbi:MAG: BREX-1 system adenine-specific DNA-methyltransferase PglX [Gemmatimonadetes bacterium]|nr:BREX-1 system adenine-specific DNA-methyltransferase PglX [Gemmatimonadota bacterium]